jgi:hypothetical protein
MHRFRSLRLSGGNAEFSDIPHGSTKISQAITTIGLDIAKSGFYVHGIYVEGKVIGARPGQSRQEN